MNRPKEFFQHTANVISDLFIQSYLSLSSAGKASDSVYNLFVHEIQIYQGSSEERVFLAGLIQQNLESRLSGESLSPIPFTIHFEGEVLVGRYLVDIDYFSKKCQLQSF